jgi:hypothetical protein
MSDRTHCPLSDILRTDTIVYNSLILELLQLNPFGYDDRSLVSLLFFLSLSKALSVAGLLPIEAF